MLIPAVLLPDRHRAAADAPTARSTPASRPPGFRPGRAHIAAPPYRPMAGRPGGRTRGRAGRRSPRSTGDRRRLGGLGWWLRRSPAQHARPSRRGTRVQGPRFSVSPGSGVEFRPSKPSPDGRPGVSRLRRAAPAGADLHQPRPDLFARGGNGDRAGRHDIGCGQQFVTGHATMDLRGVGAARQPLSPVELVAITPPAEGRSTLLCDSAYAGHWSGSDYDNHPDRPRRKHNEDR